MVLLIFNNKTSRCGLCSHLRLHFADEVFFFIFFHAYSSNWTKNVVRTRHYPRMRCLGSTSLNSREFGAGSLSSDLACATVLGSTLRGATAARPPPEGRAVLSRYFRFRTLRPIRWQGGWLYVVVSYPGVDKSALARCLQSTAVRSASLEQAAPPAPAPPRTGTGVGVLAYEKQSAARLPGVESHRSLRRSDPTHQTLNLLIFYNSIIDNSRMIYIINTLK
jgi:hypothetical protein